MAIIEKATYIDVRDQLRNQIMSGYLNTISFDSNTVYVEEWEEGGACTYSYSFSYANGVATIDPMSKQKVVLSTVATVVPEEPVTKSWLKSFLESLLTVEEEVEVIKSINEEQMISVEVFYPPVGYADLHGDGIEDVEVLKAGINSFNKAVEEGRAPACLFHTHKTECYKYGKAWVSEKATQHGDTVYPANTPFIEIHWQNPKAWELRKNGTFLSGSLRGMVGV